VSGPWFDLLGTHFGIAACGVFVVMQGMDQVEPREVTRVQNLWGCSFSESDKFRQEWGEHLGANTTLNFIPSLPLLTCMAWLFVCVCVGV
jgi:hypothetical protein